MACVAVLLSSETSVERFRGSVEPASISGDECHWTMHLHWRDSVRLQYFQRKVVSPIVSAIVVMSRSHISANRGYVSNPGLFSFSQK